MSDATSEVVHEIVRSPWVLGAIFYDPDDDRLIVRQRTGLGWTLNFGRPLAWAIVVVALGLWLASRRLAGGSDEG